jgi:3D (Asp-Asp-Asp) domain-containing protein
MKNSTLLGSATSVLLAFSVISYSKTYIQDPKPAQQPNRQQTKTTVIPNDEADAASEKPLTPVAGEKQKPALKFIFPAQAYTATAYSLHGRTASGRPVARGLIAADPRILPLGTRVRIEAGDFSGEYVVADTGGMVKGRRVDIWTPTTGETLRFGKRAVKLTVLEYGGTRSRTLTRPTTSVWVPGSATAAQPSGATKK